MELAQRLDFFSRLLHCGPKLSYWELTPSLTTVRTSCPEPEMVRPFLALSDCESYLRRYLAEKETRPLLLSDKLGLNWVAAFEVDSNVVCRVHMIGPCFTSDLSAEKIGYALRGQRLSDNVNRQFMEQLRQLPVVPVTSWFQMGLMLHYTVREEELTVSDFCYQAEPEETIPEKESVTLPMPGAWLAEQAAMQMIEAGCLDYKDVYGHLSMYASYSTPTEGDSSSRKQKNSVLSFITSCTRAAIRGGLDVETAFYVGDRYCDLVEEVGTFSELMRLNTTMFEDFVERVHKIKTAAGISPAIQVACNYVGLHISENLTLEQLAAAAGYDRYYFAKKFKREIGCTPNQFIRSRRVERAKLLLRSTHDSVQSISDQLGFCNSSYFAVTFREETGMTPAEWRGGGGEQEARKS